MKHKSRIKSHNKIIQDFFDKKGYCDYTDDFGIRKFDTRATVNVNWEFVEPSKMLDDFLAFVKKELYLVSTKSG